jgi:parvulin-like peptidyl-prolyl cis-trans isomerase-like protein
MRKSWLVCLLLGTLAVAQTTPGTPAPVQSSQAPAAGNENKTGTPAASPQDAAAAVPPNAPVITIKGVCPDQPKSAATKAAAAKPAGTSSKSASADCKTVITKAEFEKLGSALAPNLNPQQKRQLAGMLPQLIAMSEAAKKKGLDKDERYLETLKFAKMRLLANNLQLNIQEEAAKVPDAEIKEYYEKNPEAYEQFNLERIFVPRMKQATNEANEEVGKDEKLTEEQQKAKQEQEKAKQEQGEQEMTKLAETLRARAVAGEDFVALQKEAFEAAGIKMESPNVNQKVRRTALPPAQAAVFDLKPNEVSQVINDAGGHYVYKLQSKEELPLDQVKQEIHGTLQNQRMRDAMEKYQNSYQTETNDAYFGPAGTAGPGIPPRMPNPRMQSSPTQPQAKPEGQPQAPPPAPKPN